ncbi:methyltransferase domain-containing protein [Entophlyctis helioformis]|nr:methyltransferase domain-containing protein [Entophlyctis helioformis]
MANARWFFVVVVVLVAFGMIVFTLTEVDRIDKALTGVKSARPEVSNDQELDILAKCIAETADFDRNEVCWSDYKHKQVLKVLDRLDKVPRENSMHFTTMRSHSAHQAMIPSHQCDMLKIQRFGTGHAPAYATKPLERHPDGPKWMCPEYLETPDDSQCTVFSIGSNGDFQFEESINKFVGNKCKIYTFDCTGNWTNPTTEFHPWCISDKNYVDPAGRHYKTLTSMMKEVGVSKIHLFKIDVEGYEFHAFRSLEREPPESLPKQVLLEVHWGTEWPEQRFNIEKDSWLPRATSFYRSLDKMGYRIALRERNIYSECCAEYVLIRDL